MTAERDPAFVDTNVLVYAFDKSDSPQKAIAQRLLNELMEEDRLRLSTQVLQELFVTLTRKVSRGCTSEQALAGLTISRPGPSPYSTTPPSGPPSVSLTRRNSHSGTPSSSPPPPAPAPRSSTPKISTTARKSSASGSATPSPRNPRPSAADPSVRHTTAARPFLSITRLSKCALGL